MVTIFFSYRAPVESAQTLLWQTMHTEGKVVSAGRGDVPFIWIDCAGLCFSQSSPGFSGLFRHSSSLACVCLFSARGRGRNM